MSQEISDNCLREEIWNRVKISLQVHFDAAGNLIGKSSGGFWGILERHTLGFGDLKVGALKLCFPYPVPADRRGIGKPIGPDTKKNLLAFLLKPLPTVLPKVIRAIFRKL